MIPRSENHKANALARLAASQIILVPRAIYVKLLKERSINKQEPAIKAIQHSSDWILTWIYTAISSLSLQRRETMSLEKFTKEFVEITRASRHWLSEYSKGGKLCTFTKEFVKITWV